MELPRLLLERSTLLALAVMLGLSARRVRHVHTLAQAAASRDLADLVETGLLPERVLRSTGPAQTDHHR